MEGIPKARLLPFFSCESLHWFEVKVVIQMKVVEVFAMDEKVEHVVALLAHLQSNLYPIQLCGLEELCGLEGSEEIPGSQNQERDTHL